MAFDLDRQLVLAAFRFESVQFELAVGIRDILINRFATTIEPDVCLRHAVGHTIDRPDHSATDELSCVAIQILVVNARLRCRFRLKFFEVLVARGRV